MSACWVLPNELYISQHYHLTSIVCLTRCDRAFQLTSIFGHPFVTCLPHDALGWVNADLVDYTILILR